ncbi:hypothetical protein FW800_03775 [Pseudomonas sp. 910_23]|uniref:Uncharacterized protein n=1 Tax=Pseudomonas synxantha TaxID=47883 RepID=A0A5D3GCJ4_9PSED|nr:hypothetical protein [Pseudomonas sp. W2Aug9]MCK3829714.1 hypothetical protein [Pseudomonas fluorescens]MCK3840710.1 hypothetical protein [Pseudomonas sp. NCIMB 10586]MCK3843426.1 hypothetical protein [Pseudomonas sp. W15Feb34]MCK3862067.1 hypothetical protein [Pseudomonas sp. B329]TYK58191.1 hypothetical protein FXO26_09240 [Pseudomonas synxantha]
MQFVDLQHSQYLFNPPAGTGSNVGAGLPAMQATRCLCDTEVTPSQASQLPHKAVRVSVSDRGRPRSPAHFPAPVPATLRPIRCPGATR